MTNKVNPIPEHYHTITSTLIISDIDYAVEFYQSAFGVEVLELIPNPNGKNVRAVLKMGNSVFVIHHESPPMNYFPPQPDQPLSNYLCVFVEDVDAVFEQAVAAGAKVLSPIEDKYWGDRYGKVRDPFGHEWALSTRISNLTPKEVVRNYAEMVAKK